MSPPVNNPAGFLLAPIGAGWRAVTFRPELVKR
jgi:hypothetical protein